MAVNPDAPKVERFVTLGGEERLSRRTTIHARN